MTTQQSLARLGAVAAVLGAVLLLAATFLHPLGADPNDPSAAFAEYAADSFWVWSHLGQFLAVAVLGMAFVALAATLESGLAAAWGRIGQAGAAATIATAAALQAVDGVALKVMVDRWAAATGATRDLTFEAAVAVRQVEIGLASLFSVVAGLTVLVLGLALIVSIRYPTWLGTLGVLAGLGLLGAGSAQARTGFSATAMTLSMAASVVLLVWVLLAGVLMWRLAPQLAGEHEAEAQASRGESPPSRHLRRFVGTDRRASDTSRGQPAALSGHHGRCQ